MKKQRERRTDHGPKPKPEPRASPAEDTCNARYHDHSQPRGSCCPNLWKIFFASVATAQVTAASENAGMPADLHVTAAYTADPSADIPADDAIPTDPTTAIDVPAITAEKSTDLGRIEKNKKHVDAAREDGRCNAVNVHRHKLYKMRERSAFEFFSPLVTYNHNPNIDKNGFDVIDRDTRIGGLTQPQWFRIEQAYGGNRHSIEQDFIRNGKQIFKTEKGRLEFLPGFIETMKEYCPEEERPDVPTMFKEQIANVMQTIEEGEDLRKEKLKILPGKVGWKNPLGQRKEQRKEFWDGIFDWFVRIEKAWQVLLDEITKVVKVEQVDWLDGKTHTHVAECDDNGYPANSAKERAIPVEDP